MVDAEVHRGHDERWSSKLGLIVAVAGSAVGLGNFLRFPGQAAEHGGGAFMVPYFLALLLLGIPIAWVEWTLGRCGGRRGLHSAPAILGLVGGGPAFRYLGVVGLLIPLVIYLYYVLIESWCLRYTFEYLVGGMDLGDDATRYAATSEALFVRFTGSADNGLIIGGRLHPSVLAWLLVVGVNVWVLFAGLSRGIERFVRIAMPTMAVCAIIVLVRVLTLGAPDPAHPERDVVAGLGFMWNPDLAALLDFRTWLAAAGQIFFSLSVGFGIVLNYSSYLRHDDDVVLSGLTAVSTNEVFEVGFGGLITLPAAFVFLGATAAVGGTFGLGFVTLPVVFEHMGALGRAIGALWFFMLFLAAITSSLSMLQPVVAFVMEALAVPRRRAVGLVALTTTLGSLWVIYFSKDLVALDTLDFWVGTALIFVLASLQLAVFVWRLGVDRGLEEAHRGAELKIPRVYRPVLKYVAPAFLLVVFAGFCVQSLPATVRGLADRPVAAATLGFIGGLLLLLLFLVHTAGRRGALSPMDDGGGGE